MLAELETVALVVKIERSVELVWLAVVCTRKGRVGFAGRFSQWRVKVWVKEKELWLEMEEEEGGDGGGVDRFMAGSFGRRGTMILNL